MNKQFIRYVLSGSFFSILGPLFFLFISNILQSNLAILFSEFILHVLRFFSFKYFIFHNTSRNKSKRKYIFSTAPTILTNILLVNILEAHIKPRDIAIIIGLMSISIGYIWTKHCYRYFSK